ncbi:hypothetical protein HRbin12_01742 [bacterium HR12]|nr:hypothetical protein HRbin12_01742 [bacterium HR12]
MVDVDTSDAGELQARADHEIAVRARARLRLEAVVEETHDPKGLAALGLGDRVTCDLPAVLGGTQSVRVISRAVSLEDRAIHHFTVEMEAAS